MADFSKQICYITSHGSHLNMKKGKKRLCEGIQTSWVDFEGLLERSQKGEPVLESGLFELRCQEGWIDAHSHETSCLGNMTVLDERSDLMLQSGSGMPLFDQSQKPVRIDGSHEGHLSVDQEGGHGTDMKKFSSGRVLHHIQDVNRESSRFQSQGVHRPDGMRTVRTVIGHEEQNLRWILPDNTAAIQRIRRAFFSCQLPEQFLEGFLFPCCRNEMIVNAGLSGALGRERGKEGLTIGIAGNEDELRPAFSDPFVYPFLKSVAGSRVPAGRKDHLNGAIEQGEMPFRGPKLFLHDSTSIAGVGSIILSDGLREVLIQKSCITRPSRPRR